MSAKYYDGTSAYKIEEYYNYTDKYEKKNKKSIRPHPKRALGLNKKKLAALIIFVFAVAIGYLYANAVLIESATEVSDLTDKLQNAKDTNTQLSFDITSGVDLSDVKKKAETKFGMQRPEDYQNVYVDVVQNDYAEISGKKGETGGILDKMITALSSFLAYIK